MIGVLNYGSGNTGAITRAYKKLNIPCCLISKPEDFNNVTKLILPGVGSFDQVMSKLNTSGLVKVLNEQVFSKKKYVLGICVGMQVMANSSDEGKIDGLSWIEGKVKKIDKNDLHHRPYLPHMGWNSVAPSNSHPIFKGIDLDFGFYFVHSYYFETKHNENILSTSKYGIPFTSSIVHKNILATQFHPEKSHSNGLKFFENFYNLK